MINNLLNFDPKNENTLVFYLLVVLYITIIHVVPIISNL